MRALHLGLHKHLLSAGLLCGLVLATTVPAQAQAAHAKGPTPWSMLARHRCVVTAAAVGVAVSVPATVPLWLAGAAKGLAVATAITDGIPRAQTTSGQDPTPARITMEKDNLWFMVGMALLGSLINVGLHQPGFTLYITSLVVLFTVTTDGLGSGRCHESNPEPPSTAASVRTWAMTAGLVALALVPLPFMAVPTLGGAALVMIALGMLPALPFIPGLGFNDLASQFKRGGILQTASWPMFYLSGVALGLALTAALLQLSPLLAPQHQE